MKVWEAGPNFNDININDIFGDIFGDVFGTRSQSRRQRRGSDLQYNLELSLKEAVLGVQKKIKIPSHSECAECNGSGAEKGTSPTVCPNCNGSGQQKTLSFQSNRHVQLVQVMDK